jgi:hypothetical protein
MNKTPLLLIGALALSGCGIVHDVAGGGGPRVEGSGKVSTETRSVGAFTKIRTEGAFDVVVTVGSKSDLKITADDNLLGMIKTRIDGDTLVISSEGNISTSNKMEVSFSNPTLAAAEIHGSGDVTVNGIKASEFEASISGSGNITATGAVDKLEASIDGSGNLMLDNLAAKSAKVTINGSGDAEVNTDGKLDATINGSGDIEYHGTPKSVSKSINGSGDVHGS